MHEQDAPRTPHQPGIAPLDPQKFRQGHLSHQRGQARGSKQTFVAERRQQIVGLSSSPRVEPGDHGHQWLVVFVQQDKRVRLTR